MGVATVAVVRRGAASECPAPQREVGHAMAPTARVAMFVALMLVAAMLGWGLGRWTL